jgi:4-hydroxy-4-methyl-2-oxoglutarate aldolase
VLNVIVTGPPRADLADVDPLASYGVATGHEAHGTPGSVNVPVTLGGRVIRPGHAVVADDDGVCLEGS